MATRRKIALIYSYNENWIGGAYYIRNLVAALNKLPDEDKPLLVIIAKNESDYRQLIADTDYPYSERRYHHHNLSRFANIINRLAGKFLKKDLIVNGLINIYDDVDVLFPATLDDPILSECKGKLFWIPDFQEHYLPEYFPSKTIEHRKAQQSKIAMSNDFIVFSSYAASVDFKKFYPSNNTIQFVLPFAVSNSNFGGVEHVVEKYDLPEKYFICSNQFWAHKNHKIVLKALKRLIECGRQEFIVFTGKEYDYRNPGFFNELKELVVKERLENCTRFLGFIERDNQLELMRNSIAVIQPSFFEGWSTVIEDAKALNIKIIASDLAVHQEQLENYPSKLFFDPNDSEDLLKCMMKIQSIRSGKWHYDYSSDIVRYAQGFLKIADIIASR